MVEAPNDAIFRLIYRSRMRIPEARRKAELGAIFSTARSNNKRRGVSGALLVWRDFFVQALEGDEATVRELFDVIRDDPRHERVTLVEEGSAGRVFGRWSMARVADGDGEADIPLLMDRDKGGITPAARRAHTPDQEELLALMREHVRGQGQPA